MKRFIQLTAALWVCLSCAVAHADFTFAALGDTPYNDEEESRFVGMIAEINREKMAFVVHVGDFKSSWSPCTDALFQLRRDQFALFHHALIYAPGDNEWTDCWQTPFASSAVRDPLSRLQKLRSLFFSDNHALGQHKLPLIRQSAAYPEHARWEHDGIVFATLNVPGGGNNQRMPEEFAARSKALDAWVSATFEQARAQARPAVVLVMQANPFIGGGGGGSGRVGSAYASLMNTITRETMNFNGEVLLIHGDSHQYRMDQPLADPRGQHPLRNFTRLEVFGYPFMNWVRVRVAKRDGKVTFSTSPGS
jgi:hypothetical protein